VELKINPNTIAKAYGELEIRGILATQVGSGTYVSDKKPVREDNGLDRKIREVIRRFVRDMRDLGVELKEAAGMVLSSGVSSEEGEAKELGADRSKRIGGIDIER
jgi:GntR family transcriptional regulator